MSPFIWKSGIWECDFFETETS